MLRVYGLDGKELAQIDLPVNPWNLDWSDGDLLVALKARLASMLGVTPFRIRLLVSEAGPVTAGRCLTADTAMSVQVVLLPYQSGDPFEKEFAAAIVSRDESVVRRLLETPVSPRVLLDFPSAPWNYSVTPLELAAGLEWADGLVGDGLLRIAASLVEAAADPNEGGELRTPLAAACFNKNMAMVRFLLQVQADVNRTGQDGDAPLHLAIVSGDSRVIRVLLTAGADCQLSDRLGFSPLQLAVHNDRVSVLKVLLQAKADRNVGNGRVTPLHRAARQGNLGMVKLLLAAGADPTRVDQWGRTPAGLSVRKPVFLRRFLIRRVLKGPLGIFCGASCSKKH